MLQCKIRMQLYIEGDKKEKPRNIEQEGASWAIESNPQEGLQWTVNDLEDRLTLEM